MYYIYQGSQWKSIGNFGGGLAQGKPSLENCFLKFSISMASLKAGLQTTQPALRDQEGPKTPRRQGDICLCSGLLSLTRNRQVPFRVVSQCNRKFCITFCKQLITTLSLFQACGCYNKVIKIIKQINQIVELSNVKYQNIKSRISYCPSRHIPFHQAVGSILK